MQIKPTMPNFGRATVPSAQIQGDNQQITLQVTNQNPKTDTLPAAADYDRFEQSFYMESPQPRYMDITLAPRTRTGEGLLATSNLRDYPVNRKERITFLIDLMRQNVFSADEKAWLKKHLEEELRLAEDKIAQQEIKPWSLTAEDIASFRQKLSKIPGLPVAV